jgi:hypothetical protein
MSEPLTKESLRKLFELLDQQPNPIRVVTSVAHCIDGVTYGLTKEGTMSWMMPTQDWDDIQSVGVKRGS